MVYIDDHFRCFASPSEGRIAIDTTFFDGHSPEFIEGYRLVPAGKEYITADGDVIKGLSIFPAEDYNLLAKFDEQYNSLQNAYTEGVNSL